ncbi:MAG: Serine phosphatase [Candidatus Peregrinibacteria bacterium GW2011_GWA2_44_7]|nr:MAG: Serine phosphatase [Candidatus Peregrinibacteria bacterium GW2011_GWA2_44_7]
MNPKLPSFLLFHSLKSKLIAGMTLLLVLAFGISSVFLIRQKTDELGADIYHSIRGFSDLTAPQIIDFYEQYLSEESFLYFNREIQSLFTKTQEIEAIGLAEYSGTVLYDSTEEKTRQYDGEVRTIPSGVMRDRIQATYPSYELESGRVVYLKPDDEGYISTVDLYEKTVAPILPSDRIVSVIYPYGARYAVLYSPSYAILDERIQAMWMRMVLLAVAAVLGGLVYAIFFSGNITGPLRKLQAGALVLGQGDFKARVDIKTHDEVESLANTFNKMAEDLERSMQAMAYKERLTKELELAAEIQKELLPKEVPKIPGLDLAAGIIPAAEVGGDLYDFIKLDDENYFGKTRTNMFITLILWHWNPTTSQLNLVNAGHEVPLKYTANPVKTEELQKGGLALGMIPDITPLMKDQVVELQKGDCIILYTDGIPETWRNEKEQYGMPEFKRVVTQSCDLPSAEAIKVALLADPKQWSQGYEQKDDMTIMVLKKT